MKGVALTHGKTARPQNKHVFFPVPGQSFNKVFLNIADIAKPIFPVGRNFGRIAAVNDHRPRLPVISVKNRNR